MITLRAPDGAEAHVHPHGAHVTSWRPMPGGEERLFLSARSSFAEGAAIRGGIPVIFPQFAAEGPLPRHGFARTTTWVAGDAHQDGGDAVAIFLLGDSDETRAIWPHSFLATLTVRVGGTRLGVALSVDNTGTTPFSFAAALHTYLRVDDVRRAEVVGLHGARYRESSRPGVFRFDDDETVHVSGEIDRVYAGAPHRLTLREPRRHLSIESSNFPDVVLWNPGAEKAAALADMEPGGEQHMLCVEAAAVQAPLTLDPGRRWWGSQTLVAQPLPAPARDG